MKLKKFNEQVESDSEVFKDCATIITYHFEDIIFEINEDTHQVTFLLKDWLKKYGDISVSENFLKFNPDYIELMKLIQQFIQSLDGYKLYITRFFSLTETINPSIQIKYISLNSQISLVKRDIPIDLKTFKKIIADQYQINCREILTVGKKTLVLNGLSKDFYNNPNWNKFLISLTSGNNPVVEFGIHWLPSSGGLWKQFKQKIDPKDLNPFNIDNIPILDYKSLFQALHYNLSLTFEHDIKIIK
jgi:hypothetical protein